MVHTIPSSFLFPIIIYPCEDDQFQANNVLRKKEKLPLYTLSIVIYQCTKKKGENPKRGRERPILKNYITRIFFKDLT